MHQAKLEEEAKEAAKRAEEEALEAAQKLEDERKLWEDKKRQVRLEEERRKENARQKLLELEERIARREAEKLKEEEESRYSLFRVSAMPSIWLLEYFEFLKSVFQIDVLP
jgi:hypothetical protein